MTKRAGIYLRISEDRGGLRLGVERQREDCEALAARLGWSLVDIYEDNSVSAYSGKLRPRYQAMLDDVRSGRIDAVVAWHTDRLHRNTREQLDYIDLSNQYDLTTQTVSAGPLDLSTPSGRATAVTLGAWARYESEQKSERQRRAGLQSAQSGRPTGGPRPFGYKKGGRELEPQEAAAIKKACDAVLAGASLGSVTRGLNASGLPTSRGGSWQPTQVKAVLRRARNAGLRTYQGEVIGPANWPAIVDEAVWRSVDSILSDPSRKTSPGYGRKYLLSGIAFCGTCGETVSSAGTQHIRKDGSRRICYRCRTRKHVARNVEPVDEYVSGVIVGRLEKGDVAELLTADRAEDQAVLRTQAASVRADLDEAAAMFGDGSMTAAQFRSVNRDLLARLAEIEVRQDAILTNASLGDLVRSADIAASWVALDLDRRRTIVDLLMTVTLLPEEVRGARVFRPELVQIEWKDGRRD